MVGDIHRTLLKGGIFIYPSDTKHPNGKLRLLYEVAPLSFLIIQAGGDATSGLTNPLDLLPENMISVCPLLLEMQRDRKVSIVSEIVILSLPCYSL